MYKIIAIALAVLFNAFSFAAETPTKGKILVIVSSQNELKLQGNKTYPTGFYLNELTVPVRKWMESGYEITFANPTGNEPTMDAHSDSADYFGKDVAKYHDYKLFLSQLGGLKHPQKISEVISKGLDDYRGVFIPGGHAPMIDLITDPDLKVVLNHFHSNAKPTGLICHGPISLIAAMPNAKAFVAALSKRNGQAKAKKLADGWIYSGYQMTIFSTAEEKSAEKGQLGGKMLFYPEAALQAAGGDVTVAKEWQSNIVRDRELITGQNPFSDGKFAETYLTALGDRLN